MPEVGSQPSMTANTRMPAIATQKSGALAPASEITLADAVERAPRPVRRERADHHGECQSAAAMVIAASSSVVGNASSTTSSAGRALRIELAEIEPGEIARGTGRTAPAADR